MPLTRPIAILLLLGVLAFGLWRWSDPGTGTVKRSRIVMGTVVEITALAKDQAAANRAVSAAFEEMARIERLMSSHLPKSEVSRLSGPVAEGEVSSETAEIIALGLNISAQSGGAFDLTLGRLKSLWQIESESPRIPDATSVAAALEGTGPQALLVDGQRVIKKSPRLQIDLGGIAKGYAVDRAAAVLTQAGITSATVNAGGDIRLVGSRQGRPWRIGIQHPRRQGALLATLELSATSVVTSGDYERFFERDGLRYHHLFDPRTGYPGTLCQSVTIVADSAALADALATAVFVLGPQHGMALLSETPGAEGMIVAADGTVSVSAGLKDRVRWP